MNGSWTVRSIAAVVVALVAACTGTGERATAPPDPTSAAEARVPVTTAPFTEREPGCLATVDALPAPADVELAMDPLDLVLRRAVVPMPLPGHEQPLLVQTSDARTVDEYFEVNPNVIAPEERREAMVAAGLVAAVGADLSVGDDHYGIALVRFESVEGARRYYDLHLRRACRDAVGLTPLDDPPGGVRYTRDHGDDPAPRALALVGDTEIAITICRCVDRGDRDVLAAEWLSDITAQLVGAGRAAAER